MARRFWVRLAWIGTFVVLVVMAIAWFAEPTYERIKRYRARGMVADIASYYESGDWMGFESRLLAATQLAPDDEAVMLAQARYLSARQHPLAMDYWMKVVQRFPRNAEVWEGMFLTSIQSKDHQTAAVALEGFRRAAPDRIDEVREHEVQWLAALGRIHEAIVTARAHLQKAQPGDAFKIAAYLMMLEGNEADRTEALNWLWSQAEGRNSTSLAALVGLAKVRTLDPGETRKLVQLLQTHPEALLEHGHLAAALESRQLAASGADADEPWRTFISGKPLEARVQIARWLVSVEAYDQAAIAITAEEALLQRDAAAVYLDVLAARAHWSEMEELLNRKELPLLPVVREAMRARVVREQGDVAQFDLSWRRARREASGDLKGLSFLANYADQQGWKDEAEQVCRSLTEELNGDLRGWMGLYNLAVKHGDTELQLEAKRSLDALFSHQQ